MNAKTVLVFSDSHGDVRDMLTVCRQEQADLVVHLGDHPGDARKLAQSISVPVHFVRGNCDFGDDAEDICELQVFSHKLVLTHGHLYHAKYSYDRLSYLAEERGAAAVLFGHTHLPLCEYTGGAWLLNPGSISGTGTGQKSYLKLMVGAYGVVPKLFYR